MGVQEGLEFLSSARTRPVKETAGAGEQEDDNERIFVRCSVMISEF